MPSIRKVPCKGSESDVEIDNEQYVTLHHIQYLTVARCIIDNTKRINDMCHSLNDTPKHNMRTSVFIILCYVSTSLQDDACQQNRSFLANW